LSYTASNRRRSQLFLQRVPLAALRTLSAPTAGHCATVATDESWGCFFDQLNLFFCY
jgi:hypothetical protein